jgi:hypothetical protein
MMHPPQGGTYLLVRCHHPGEAVHAAGQGWFESGMMKLLRLMQGVEGAGCSGTWPATSDQQLSSGFTSPCFKLLQASALFPAAASMCLADLSLAILNAQL